MSTTMGTGEVIVALAGSSVLSAVVTKLLGRRSDALTALTAAYSALAKRVADLEANQALIEGKLGSERQAHEGTRRVLHIALGYIREFRAWAAGDRRDPMPEAPADVRERL
ncbi:hypothetical protein ONA92_18525 [Mycobacteroides salmoniphilum]|uniref:hypothetical protein n=1 Tax=Mycobacteroides salmoniphilum TaxID=404941 RepID=UPI00356A0C7B